MNQNIPPGMLLAGGPRTLFAMTALPAGGPIATWGGLIRLDPGAILACVSILTSELAFLNFRGVGFSSSLMEKALLPSSAGDAENGEGCPETGRCGILKLRAESSVSPLLRPIKLLMIVLVLEPSRFRRGLTGGSGGGKPWSVAVLLPDRGLDILLDLASRASVADCGRLIVGTLLVDMTNVGSEISLLLMTRFIELLRVLEFVPICGFGASEGRLGGGYVGVGGVDPLLPVGCELARGSSNTAVRGDRGEAPADTDSLAVLLRRLLLRLVPEPVLSRDGPGPAD